jgi:hypothetical protein
VPLFSFLIFRHILYRGAGGARGGGGMKCFIRRGGDFGGGEDNKGILELESALSKDFFN